MPSRFRNLFLLLASYAFYAWGSLDFLLILLGATLVDHFFVKLFTHEKTKKTKKLLFTLSIIFNLSLLAYFKYANFFVEEFSLFLGLDPSGWIKIVLPLGISFFTFQKISYLVDVYRGTEKPTSRFRDYALYIALFPQLIAGPIVRYGQIANQLRTRTHTFDKFFEGAYLFTIGLSMKVLLADPLGEIHAEMTDLASFSEPSSAVLMVGILAYAFQIYFDFAGYSKMAIGIGKILGFNFPENFNRPYLAKSITEFWRRWHMTLTGFLKEYVYFPLGGSRGTKLKTATNLFIIFLLTGIWHGANWTFLVWGIYFGIIIVLEKFVYGKWLEKLPAIAARLLTFLIVYIGWILFQAESIELANHTLTSILSFDRITELPLLSLNPKNLILLITAAIISLVPLEFAPLKRIEKKTAIRSALILGLLFICFLSVAGDSYHPFLYFRF